jgi:predicted nucleic acid-binding protein
MRPLLLSVALLAAAAPSGRADPFVQHCDQALPPARIQVRASFAEPAISFDLTAAQIKPLSQTTQPGVSLGLTQVETRVEQRVSVQALASRTDQRLCGRPEIDLTLALHRARIHVARELLGNDCAVAAVWHHELRHFAIYQETLTEVAAEVERLMLGHYRDVVLIGTEREIREEIQRDLRERWSREIEVLQLRGNTEHEALDARDGTVDEAVCGGALARLAGRLARESGL